MLGTAATSTVSHRLLVSNRLNNTNVTVPKDSRKRWHQTCRDAPSLPANACRHVRFETVFGGGDSCIPGRRDDLQRRQDGQLRLLISTKSVGSFVTPPAEDIAQLPIQTESAPPTSEIHRRPLQSLPLYGQTR